MSEAPERISVYPLEGTWGYGGMEFAEGDEPGLIGYTRTDLIPAMVEAAYRMAIADVAKRVRPQIARVGHGVVVAALHRVADDLLTLTPPDDLVERVKGETK